MQKGTEAPAGKTDGDHVRGVPRRSTRKNPQMQATENEALGAAVINSLAQMLAELESNHLTVILVPQRRHTNEGGCIRVAASRNITWYRHLCARHPSSRTRRNSAPDTRIRRAEITRLLNRLINRQPIKSMYAKELIEIARKEK